MFSFSFPFVSRLIFAVEGKTDYYARRRLIAQDKNKYNSPKYRLVVRFTNKDVICQVVYSRIQGDFVLCSAYAHELPRYGVKVGLTNYAAAYCTGLLCARRLLQIVGLAQKYPGKEVADGASFSVTPIEEESRPFKAFLDVGLRRTTTGAKIFAAMKGAVDGGLFVPHSDSRFVGYQNGELDSAKLRKHILGLHVAEYMKALRSEEPEKYKRCFSKFLAAGVEPDDLEAMYVKAHKAIRADPSPRPTKHVLYPRAKQQRLTLDERKARVQAKIDAHFSEQ